MQQSQIQSVVFGGGLGRDMPKTSDGYYVAPLGACNATSRATNEYFEPESVQALLAPGSPFQTFINEGCLYGEYGHPKPVPGEKPEAFLSRCSYVSEERTSHFIRKVWCQKLNPSDPASPIVQMGEILPFGIFKEIAQDALSNRDINASFSVRAWVDRVVKFGRIIAITKGIVTWDLITRAGMPEATKFTAPLALALSQQNMQYYNNLLEVVSTTDINPKLAAMAVDEQKHIENFNFQNYSNNILQSFLSEAEKHMTRDKMYFLSKPW